MVLNCNRSKYDLEEKFIYYNIITLFSFVIAYYNNLRKLLSLHNILASLALRVAWDKLNVSGLNVLLLTFYYLY